MNKKIIWAIIIFLIIASGVFLTVKNATSPGKYDDFAKCLSDNGVVVYGAMDWCEYTQGQKAMFGKSFKYLNAKLLSTFSKAIFSCNNL